MGGKGKAITYRKLIAKIVVFSIAMVFVGAFGFSYYLKQRAISELAVEEARKISRLAFESLYSAMERGWTKADLREITQRLNSVDPDMRIAIYRSPMVAALFGDIPRERQVRDRDPLVQKALEGHEQLIVGENHSIRYLYPVRMEPHCLKCHTNLHAGDVAGAIDIVYPITQLKISLSTMLNSVIVFFVGFLLLIFVLLYFNLYNWMVRPLENFIASMRQIMGSGDLTRQVDLNTNIKEIQNIDEIFNQLIGHLHSQFYTDALTGLPNRQKLLEDLRKKSVSALALVNIDRFREINDLFGDRTGDAVLTSIAQTISSYLDPGRFTLYRVGGDEYAITTTRQMEEKSAVRLIRRLARVIGRTEYHIEDFVINVRVTAGVAEDGSRKEGLLTAAHAALKTAKMTHKPVMAYSKTMHAKKEYADNIIWTKKLRQAIQEDRIIPVFQPMLELATGKIRKYESLMRMRDEEGKLIAPGLFLPVAKQARLYPKLTRIMINKTFGLFEDRTEEFSINLAIDDILDADIVAFIEQRLKSSPAANRAVFEIVESEGIENYREVLSFIRMVQSYGCKVAIDDFGTGYSNFGHILQLDVDFIKIDGSLIRRIDVDASSQVITEAIVAFSRKLGIRTVAEFVHSRAVREKVLALGVDFAQGYLFGEPSAKID